MPLLSKGSSVRHFSNDGADKDKEGRVNDTSRVSAHQQAFEEDIPAEEYQKM